VDFDSASRGGEPFEALIRKRQYLPNPVTRFCTTELKIRAIHKYLKSLGWEHNETMDWVGIRADEARRAAKIDRSRIPLVSAGITVHDVNEFWSQQPFNLNLPTYQGRTLAGNCDLCYLKPANQIFTLIKEKPERAIWWVRMEALALALASKPSGARFRKDRAGYAEMLKFSEQQTDMFGDEEAMACFCGD
jgi:3'-phosphoadenosine 5'-phosphosulfate sulfotransferase (PAPS reductase)/FAD synthetase